MRKLLTAMALALPLLAFASPGALPPTEKVLESYEVGANVVARAFNVQAASNTLWVGTSIGALEIDLKTQNLRNTYNRQHGLANEFVYAVGYDSQGFTWFGTNSGGASRFKGGRWNTYLPMHGLADYWVYAFANDRTGKLWIGTRSGANLFDVRTGKFKTYAKELVDPWVYGIAVDSAGKVWFGTQGGVSMFDGARWASWTHEQGLGAPDMTSSAAKTTADSNVTAAITASPKQDLNPNAYSPNYVLSILAAPDKTIWAGTWGGGVSRFDGKTWSNLTTKDGLAGNIVYAVARDNKGVFWFGTNNGLSRFDGKAWRNLGKQDGLLDNDVYAVALAPNGDVWAGTRMGVTRVGIEQTKR